MSDNSYEKMWKQIMKEKGISKEEAINELEELISPYPSFTSWEEAKLKKNKKAIKAKRTV